MYQFTNGKKMYIQMYKSDFELSFLSCCFFGSLISGTILGLSLDIPSLLVAGTAILVLLQVSTKVFLALSKSFPPPVQRENV
jgi:hypothetical protein